MTPTAVLAAATSLVAAVLAFLSARRAERAARWTVSVNHRVAEPDRRVDQLRTDYADLMRSMGDVRTTSDTGKVMSACDILRVNPLASPDLLQASIRAST